MWVQKCPILVFKAYHFYVIFLFYVIRIHSLSIFVIKFDEKYCHISNWHPQIFQDENFCVKRINFKFESKSTIFLYL